MSCRGTGEVDESFHSPLDAILDRVLLQSLSNRVWTLEQKRQVTSSLIVKLRACLLKKFLVSLFTRVQLRIGKTCNHFLAHRPGRRQQTMFGKLQKQKIAQNLKQRQIPRPSLQGCF